MCRLRGSRLNYLHDPAADLLLVDTFMLRFFFCEFSLFGAQVWYYIYHLIYIVVGHRYIPVDKIRTYLIDNGILLPKPVQKSICPVVLIILCT